MNIATRTHRTLSRSIVCAALSAAALVPACAPGTGEDGIGSVALAITNVPANVACVQIVVSGSTTATDNFTVAAGASSVLNLGALNPGTATLTATGFNVACASITGVTPTWVADPVSAAVTAGLTTNVNITLRPNTGTTATVDFAVPAVEVAAGNYASYAVLSDGTVRAWGINAWGNLGDGTYTQRTAPVAVSGISTARHIVAGNAHACALLADGTAKCWGWGAYGQLGNGLATTSTTPVAVTMPAGVTFTQITAGYDHTCAVGSNAVVYCWGGNASGEVGDGTTTYRAVPTATSVTNGVEVRAGHNFTCARNATGVGICWGDNTQGQFAGGTTTSSLTPVSTQYNPIVGLSATQGGTCALTPAGAVQCAGYNYWGQLGDGTQVARSLPAAVTGLSNVVSLASGSEANENCAVRGDGIVLCWGCDNTGQIGNGSIAPALTATPVLGIANATSVAVGGGHACAVRNDGAVFCWGVNTYGQIGDATLVTRFTATRVTL